MCERERERNQEKHNQLLKRRGVQNNKLYITLIMCERKKKDRKEREREKEKEREREH